MAQPGNFTPILLYSSSTSTNVPLAANLTNSANGAELAINIADKNLFFKDSGGTVNTVPIRQSSTSSNGWLSSADWNTFNSKASATIGTSLLYGNGTGGFSNVTIGSGISFAGGTLSATGSGGTVTSVTGTAPVVSSGGTTPAISMPAATTSVNGYLTSTDWNTFNGKVSSQWTTTSSDIYYTTGNVGIGTNTPPTKLSLKTADTGTAYNVGFSIANAANGATGQINLPALAFGDGTGNYWASIDAYRGIGLGNGGLRFYTYNTSNAAVEALRIWASTGVSIGNTTDPGATNLVVNGTITNGGNVGVGTATLPASGINIGKQYGGVNLSGGGGTWAQWGGGYGLFPYSGVGLGIATSANIGFVNSAGTQVASISGTTGVYTPLSDRNQKKDFEPSTIGLDAVMQLKPTLYRMTNDDESVPKQLWFIAQDVEPVIPQAFIKNVISGEDTPEEISFIGLDERPIIAALTLALQQLNNKFDAYVASHP